MKIFRKTAVWRAVVGISVFVLLLSVTVRYAAMAVDMNEMEGGGLDLSLELFASGLNSPVSMTHAGDDRLFVVEQAGRIRIVESNGTVLTTPFLDIVSRVDDSASEEGLLGLAFHPEYDTNGYFYVNYIHTTGGTRRTRISRFTVTGDPNVADPNSENVLLTINQPDWNHNAGDIHFGPDGYLYVPLGDGGGGGDTDNNTQNLGLLLGKITRIDVDQGAGSAPDCVGVGSGDYTIPSSNPLIDGAGNTCDEIWAIGLRNPWRTSFDRETGDFYMADVGQSAWEEVSFQPADSTGGENYGWRCYEGNHAFNTSGCSGASAYVFPIAEYSHGGGNCSITGGYVYRGTLYPTMAGHYLYTDYCSGNFWDLISDGGGGWTVTQHSSIGFGYTTFGEAANCELYIANSNGSIYHIVENSAMVPLVAAFNSNSPLIVGDTAVFTSTVTGPTPVSYHWDFGDGSPSSNEENPTHLYDVPGEYTVSLTVREKCQSVTVSQTVVVEAIPVTAGFIHNSPVRLGGTAVLSNTSTGTGPITYNWDMGDGTLLSGEHINHTYATIGTYTISMTATSPYSSDTMMAEFVVFTTNYDTYLPLIRRE